MKIALVDDDAAALSNLYALVAAELQSYGSDHHIDTYTSGEAFLEQWSSGKFDLIILDIYMESLTGVDVAELIRRTDATVRIAFCTTSNEFASESYQVNACDYLLKPVNQDKISRLIMRVCTAQMELSRSVKLPDGTSIQLRNILYTEYFNHRITFVLKVGQSHKLYTSFSAIEALLMPYGFFYSPVKGVLVNFYEVTQITADSFLMKNGHSLPITRRKYKEAKEKYSIFQFRTLSKEVDFG